MVTGVIVIVVSGSVVTNPKNDLMLENGPLSTESAKYSYVLDLVSIFGNTRNTSVLACCTLTPTTVSSFPSCDCKWIPMSGVRGLFELMDNTCGISMITTSPRDTVWVVLDRVLGHVILLFHEIQKLTGSDSSVVTRI